MQCMFYPYSVSLFNVKSYSNIKKQSNSIASEMELHGILKSAQKIFKHKNIKLYLNAVLK